MREFNGSLRVCKAYACVVSCWRGVESKASHSLGSGPRIPWHRQRPSDLNSKRLGQNGRGLRAIDEGGCCLGWGDAAEPPRPDAVSFRPAPLGIVIYVRLECTSRRRHSAGAARAGASGRWWPSSFAQNLAIQFKGTCERFRLQSWPAVSHSASSTRRPSECVRSAM